jgi:hypothetical protein
LREGRSIPVATIQEKDQAGIVTRDAAAEPYNGHLSVVPLAIYLHWLLWWRRLGDQPRIADPPSVVSAVADVAQGVLGSFGALTVGWEGGGRRADRHRPLDTLGSRGECAT